MTRVAILKFQGDLTHREAGILTHDIEEMIAQDALDSVVFDMSRVKYMDSAGLSVLEATHRRMHAHGGHIALCNVRPLVLAVLQITSLTDVFPIYDDLRTATRTLESAGALNPLAATNQVAQAPVEGLP